MKKKTALLATLVLLILCAITFTACNNNDVNEIITATSAESDETDNTIITNGNERENEKEDLALSEFPAEPVPRGLPSLHIYGIAAHAIHRHNWTRGITVSLRGECELSDFENIRARIRGRGNSTWWGMGEKRPYRLRFESPRAMFGTEYIARDWVLLANAIDYSHMRTVGAFELGMRLGRFDFSPLPAQFVHLYIDGDYRGVYQFTDQMQRGQGRIDVNFHTDPALSEFYLHWCKHWRHPDDIWFNVGGIPFEIRYPRADDITDAHVEFARDFIQRLDIAMRAGDFDVVSELIDMPSFVDFYLVNEFTKNADVFFSSVNFSLRLEENGRHRLYAGPLWDFDQSAGGTFDSFYPDYSPRGPWAAYRNDWFRRLMRIPEFRNAVSARWFGIRDVEVAATLDTIRYLAFVHREDFERNFVRWPNKLGQYLWRTPPSMQRFDTYEGQVEYLLDWYEQRIIWMDEFLG